MGWFSFGPKARTEAPRRARRTSDARTALQSDARAESHRPDEALFAETQRARYRIVGAVILMLTAMMVLPRLLHAPPQGAMGDLEIQVPAQALTVRFNPVNAPVQVASAPRAAPPSGVKRTIPSPDLTEASVPASPPASLPAADSAAAPPSSAQPAAAPPDPPRLRMSNGSGHDRPSASKSYFAIQAGIFVHEHEARSHLMRLKKAQLPAYLEREKRRGGGMRFLVRAGPFRDRLQAEAALKQLHAAGLTVSRAHTQARH